MVIAFIFKFALFPFLHMTQGPIRSTLSLFCGIYSASLSGNDHIFTIIFFLPGGFYNAGSVKNDKSFSELYPLLYEGDTYDTNVIRNFEVLTE